MEPAYYKNFYSSNFAQPLPEAQRLEAMNARINANELALYTGFNIDLHSRFCWQNQNHFGLQFSIGARARARAKYELALTVSRMLKLKFYE